MAAPINKRRLLLMFSAAVAAAACLAAGSRSFLRPTACAAGATSVNSSGAAGGLAECALRCIGSSWCAALLIGRSGCCDCALIDWELYYGSWFGQGAVCPSGLFEKEAAVELLRFSSCQQINGTYGATCLRAMDGITQQNYFAGSCTHTTASNHNWWRASLSERAFIETIALYNRQDCCSQRLNNFTISLDGSVFASYFSASVFSTMNFSCSRVGQTVQVDQYMTSDNFLTLCEVMVYGRRFQ